MPVEKTPIHPRMRYTLPARGWVELIWTAFRSPLRRPSDEHPIPNPRKVNATSATTSDCFRICIMVAHLVRINGGKTFKYRPEISSRARFPRLSATFLRITGGEVYGFRNPLPAEKFPIGLSGGDEVY